MVIYILFQRFWLVLFFSFSFFLLVDTYSLISKAFMFIIPITPYSGYYFIYFNMPYAVCCPVPALAVAVAYVNVECEWWSLKSFFLLILSHAHKFHIEKTVRFIVTLNSQAKQSVSKCHHCAGFLPLQTMENKQEIW